MGKPTIFWRYNEDVTGDMLEICFFLMGNLGLLHGEVSHALVICFIKSCG